MGTIEPLITRLVQRLMYQPVPQGYSSMADPELDQQVRKACYGPPAMWRDTLVKLGVTVVSDLVDWAALGCLWEDRNVIAHRGSVVDARPSSATGSEAGAVLQLSPEDVQTAIDQADGTLSQADPAGWPLFSRLREEEQSPDLISG
jgi:hypothetical protein